MGVKVANTCLQWTQRIIPQSPSSSQALASAISSPSSKRRSRSSCSSDIGPLVCRYVQGLDRSALFGPQLAKQPHRSRSCEYYPKPRIQHAVRRTCSASLDAFDENENETNCRDNAVNSESESRDSRDGFVDPPWEEDEIIQESIERKANSVDLPLSLRIIKRKLQWQDGFREAGESAYCSVKKAFSSMVFIIRELHSFTLQMREILFYEDLQGILVRVQREMHASFVWLFQQVFSHTPTLMVYVMILLANFTVHSMASNTSLAATPPPAAAYHEYASTVEVHNQRRHKFDSSSIKSFSVFSSRSGKTTSIGGNNGGGGKIRPIGSGTDGDGGIDRVDHFRTIVPDGASHLSSFGTTRDAESVSGQGTQLGLFLKKILKGEVGSLSKAEFMEAISQYLGQKTSLVSGDHSKFCICGEKREVIQHSISRSCDHAELTDRHQKQLQELKLQYLETKGEVKEIQSNWEEELYRLEHYIKNLEVASSSYQKVLEENRVLYNQVQDLKGTIRVYCRVRPFLPGQSNGQSTVDYIGENGNIMVTNPFKQGKDARKMFLFNKVFAPNVSQEQIYVDTQPLVRSVLDGFNVCIFAYGQTGSGKTYTMSGPDLTAEETWGVNYRALRDLFQISNTRGDMIKYEVGVQMIEIYNEQVRDLLVSDGSNRRLDIRNTAQANGLNVPDASLIPVTSTEDVIELMRIGQKNRAVGATALNERSSRSHSVLTVHVLGRELVTGSILKGCLHLVDLAGSERVDKSEAVGERLKEAQHINRSLSALGDVISALAQKSAHIPYRNSKLTQVLQDSLGGHAKTLMFVHINPEHNAIGETISTLKFAERVSSIELGAARSNKESGEIRELREEISNLKQTLEKKEAELEQLRRGVTRNTSESQKPRAVSPFHTSESQKPRAVSPFHVPRYGISASLKPGINQPNDDSRSLEPRSTSSGKQRRSRFPSALTDKEPLPKIPLVAEDRLGGSSKPRTSSPSVRRSISTDRGTLLRSRVKADTTENQPISRVPFPARVPVNKSISATPVITSSIEINNSRVYIGSQEPAKQQDNVLDTLASLQKVSHRSKYPEHEDDQIRQALNIRQGGIRKSKPESKAKAKHQLPARFQKSDMGITLLSDMDTGEKMDEARKSDFSEPENEHSLLGSPVHSELKMTKVQQNFSRNSQNLEPSRGLVQPVEPFLAEKLENKLRNAATHQAQEGGNNTSMPEFKRSRSSPRGKFLI